MRVFLLLALLPLAFCLQWTAVPNPHNLQWVSVFALNDSSFIFVGNNLNINKDPYYYFQTTDMVNFTSLDVPFNSPTVSMWQDNAGAIWTIAGEKGSNAEQIYTSSDFNSWTYKAMKRNGIHGGRGLSDQPPVYGNGNWLYFIQEVKGWNINCSFIIYRSSDGLNWELANHTKGGIPQQWVRPAFGNEVFKFGMNGTIFTTSNGETWESVDAPYYADESFMTFANGLWFYFGFNFGQIDETWAFVSKDGETWSNTTLPVNYLYTIQYFEQSQLYVAVLINGTFATSSDGYTWAINNSWLLTFKTTGRYYEVADLAYNGKTYVSIVAADVAPYGITQIFYAGADSK